MCLMIIFIIFKSKPVDGDLTNHQVLCEMHVTNQNLKEEIQQVPSWEPDYSLGITPRCTPHL